MNQSKKAIVLASGGVDSATCLGLAVEKYGKDQVIALSMYYGQKHDKEIQAARAISEYFGVKHKELDLSFIFQESDCTLLKQSSANIPTQSYEKQLEETDGKHVSTYVPFRNG